jgi:hypothetical protein
MSYANGEVYEGEWKEGKKEGKGKMGYPNGDEYEGRIFGFFIFFIYLRVI